MNTKHANLLATATLIATALTCVHAFEYDRKLNREPTRIPDTPQTFDRAYVELKAPGTGNGDHCFDWEARENNGNSKFGPVICRQKCPPGYGASKDKCVWQQTFQKHTRLQNIASRGDLCWDDKGPQTYSVKQNGTNIDMQLQLNEVKHERSGRTACTTMCPTEFGWAEATDDTCVFKENYKRILSPVDSSTSTAVPAQQQNTTAAGNLNVNSHNETAKTASDNIKSLNTTGDARGTVNDGTNPLSQNSTETPKFASSPYTKPDPGFIKQLEVIEKQAQQAKEGKQSDLSGCAPTDERIPDNRCGRKCAPGYKPNPQDATECLWTGAKN